MVLYVDYIDTKSYMFDLINNKKTTIKAACRYY